MNEKFFSEIFFRVEIFAKFEKETLMRAEADGIQTETKRDYCDKIYTERLYWITGGCLFFR